MMKVILRLVYLSIFLISLASCSTTKFVNEGDYLLDKVIIQSDNPDYTNSDLKSYVRQQPNFKLFGLVKWQLYVYNWSGRDEKNWFNKQLRRIGEAPVILDSVLVEQSQTELDRFLFNKGYTHANVTTSIDTTRRKKAAVTYHITSNEPYRIRNYQLQLEDAKIDSIAHLQPVRRSSLANAFRSAPENFTPLVKEGNLFDRDVLDQERQRLTAMLRRRGYYAFNKNHIGFLADSTHNQYAVDVEMLLQPFRKYNSDGTVEEVPHRQYYINDVSILTDYNAMDDSESRFTPTDTVRNKALTVVYGQSGRSIRSRILRDATYLYPGQLYNERNVEQTYSSLTSLRALKNVNIRFAEFEENDSLKLDCIIQTSFSKPQSFGFDIEGTNNAGDLGFASSLNYQHRNIFKGAEVFSARIRGAYESLGRGSDSYWEYGGEASILFPRFLFPFLSYDFKRRLRASTELRLSYNRQDRPEYERSIFSGSWNYIWQDRSNALARHTFKLLDVDYVLLPWIDQEFKNNLPEALLRYNYTDQFIVAAGYTYSFNNYTPQNRLRNTHSLRVSLETAGNVLYGLSALTGAKKDEEGNYKLFGTDYSQFVKADIDVSQGIILDNRNRLAFHLGIGVGVPYGNAKMLPFERRYFAGGANSVRGWSVRSLGPGSMQGDSLNFVYKVGDIRLDMNVEYRTKLFWKFELAAYIDAGNIWTIRPYSDQPNGNFDFSRFYKEIAVSYGLGLRMDFDFFLLRLDTGFKAYNPQKSGDKRWAILHPNFNNNFAWHFAVGYPF